MRMQMHAARVSALVLTFLFSAAGQVADPGMTCKAASDCSPARGEGMLVIGSPHLFQSLRDAGADVVFAELPKWDEYLQNSTSAVGGPILTMQPLLDYAMPMLQKYLADVKPRWVVVHSKGVSVACELVRRNLWAERFLISSPIINPSDALQADDYDGMGTLLSAAERVDVVMGTNEEVIIMESGLDVVAERHGWRVHFFHGGHWWYGDERNSLRLTNWAKNLLAD
mmetsp:Transcript_44541/g.105557  ORF Transcript_44541/g.105557 Transcript_44541/m.105557 type:complete len:226 (+) Transcript_44541:72-749(+)